MGLGQQQVELGGGVELETGGGLGKETERSAEFGKLEGEGVDQGRVRRD